MLIINDIDIIQTNANKVAYHSNDVEKKQSLDNRITTLQTINTFPAITKKSVEAGRSSVMNIQTNLTNNQSATNKIENETLIPISQINQYRSK